MPRSPSAAALAFVIAQAQSYAGPGRIIGPTTLVRDIPQLGHPGAWSFLLLGAGFDEFHPVEPEREPETIEDVARHYDVLDAVTQAVSEEVTTTSALPSDFLEQLTRMEEQQEGRDVVVSGAVYADPDRSRPTSAGWWRSGAGDVVAVFTGTGGQHAGDVLTRLVGRALGAGAIARASTTQLLDRARGPIDIAHAAVAQALGPAFVAQGSMVCAAVEGHRVGIAHVGDARALVVRAGGVERLTEDHAVSVAGATALLRGIGIGDRASAAVSTSTLMQGDVLVLYTASVARSFDAAALGARVISEGPAAADRIVAELAAASPAGAFALVRIECRGASAAHP